MTKAVRVTQKPAAQRVAKPKKPPVSIAAATPAQASGDIPLLQLQPLAHGVCPVCIGIASVKVHKLNGYSMRCLSCGLHMFTRTPHGSIAFRSQQEVLKAEEIRQSLRDLARPLYEQFATAMTATATAT